MSYLHDAAVVAWVTLASGAIGAPFAALLPTSGFRLRWALAPPLGFGLLAAATGAGYVQGVAGWVPVAALASAGLVVAAAMAIAARRHGTPSWRCALVPTGVVLAVSMVCLAPAWTGGYRFRVFQGNVYDHLHYVGTAIAYRVMDYATLTGAPVDGRLADPIASPALWFVNARGSVSMVLAVVADTVGGSAIDCAYPYMVALQLNMLFASLFVFANVLKLPRPWTFLCAAALTVGTFEQYIFDINALSQLAAQPLYLLLFGWASVAFDPGRCGRASAAIGRLALITSALTAGVLYLYPEAWAIYGAAIGVAGVVALYHSGSRPSVPVAVGGLAGGAALGLLLCVPLWSGTGAYFVNSLSAARAFTPDWWQYFQRHLLGREENYLELIRTGAGSPGARLGAWFSLPVEAAMAALGLFLVLPARDWPLPVALVWKVALYGLLTLLLWSTGRVLRQLWRTEPERAATRLLVGSLAGCLVPVVLLATGHAWAAGKGLAMAAPLLFALVVSPLASRGPGRRGSAAGGVIVAAHLGLGLLRPVLVTGLVVAPGLPTAAAQVEGQKARLDWDYGRLAGEISRCGGVVIDTPNPVMSSLLRLIAFESGVPWAGPKSAGWLISSSQDHFPAGWQQFNCLASADRLTPAPGQRLINLAADRVVSDFVEGRRDTLEIGVDNPSGIIRQGLPGVENTSQGPLQWAARHVSLELPNRAGAPARRLHFLLWPMPLSSREFSMRVNGSELYRGAVPNAAMSFDLEPFAAAAALKLELEADAVTRYPGDPRELGFAIRELKLCR